MLRFLLHFGKVCRIDGRRNQSLACSFILVVGIPTTTLHGQSWFMQKWATTWQNPQSDRAPSECSDQPGHPPSLIRVFACAHWVAKGPSFLHADSEDSGQTGRMPRLIWVFAGRTVILLVLTWCGSIIQEYWFRGYLNNAHSLSNQIIAKSSDESSELDETSQKYRLFRHLNSPKVTSTSGWYLCLRVFFFFFHAPARFGMSSLVVICYIICHPQIIGSLKWKQTFITFKTVFYKNYCHFTANCNQDW